MKLVSVKVMVVKQSLKIRSLIHKFEFEFSFPLYAIRFVIVTKEHAYSEPRSRIVYVISARLPVLHRQLAR